MIRNNIKLSGARRLPIAQIEDSFFYVDERLKQFREVTNPHNFIDFDSDKGQKMVDNYYGTENMSAVERFINMLKKEGWAEQESGANYINGTMGTNLFKDGEVITILQNFSPDEEFIEENWGQETK